MPAVLPPGVTEETSYVPRLTEPSTTDKWWIHTSKGGENPCILIKGNSCLPNCFAGETEFVTSKGVRRLSDCVNDKVKVFCNDYDWHDAEVKYFGKSQLYRVDVGRSTYYATANHRWFAYRDGKYLGVLTTSELKSDMEIPYALSNDVVYEDDVTAIRHGFIYGDGTKGYKNRSTSAALCGKKRDFMFPYFAGEKMYYYKDGTIEVPFQLKEGKTIPSITSEKKYLYNFLRGYFAADGSVDYDGSTINITCKDSEPLEQIRSICAVLGIRTGVVATHISSGYTGMRPLSELSLMKSCLTPEFFLNPQHRERFCRKFKKRVCYARVRQIESTERYEDVFCVVEPVTHSFTLGRGELTGNCVGYAFGRFSEIMGKRASLPTCDAGKWFSTCKAYEKGQTPKLGAVICWSNSGAGHVAVVEQIHSDGSITTSNSAYGGTRFYTKKASPPNYHSSSNYHFQGFIYNPSVKDSTHVAQPADDNKDSEPAKLNVIQAFIACAMSHVGEDGTWAYRTHGLEVGQPWCAAFVGACAKTVGIAGKCIFATSSASDCPKYGVQKGYGKWYKGPYWGPCTFTPMPGDLILYRWFAKETYIGEDEFKSNHIGIVREADAEHVYTVEGNTTYKGKSSMCGTHTKDRYASTINGYFRPDWSLVGGEVFWDPSDFGYSPGGTIGDLLIGDTVGSGYNWFTGSLYTTKSTAEDAAIRQVAYMTNNGEPSITPTGIRLSVVNYTSSLASLVSLAMFGGSLGLTPTVDSSMWPDLFPNESVLPGYTPSPAVPGGSPSPVIPGYTPTPSTPGTTDTSALNNSVASFCASFLLGKGIPLAQTCGILANIECESSFVPSAVNSKSGASGLVQWLGSRKTDMIKYVGNDWKNDVSGQMDFVWHELNSSEKKAYKALMEHPNTREGAQDAADTFMKKYERPGVTQKRIDKERRLAGEFWDKLVVASVNYTGYSNPSAIYTQSNQPAREASVLTIPASEQTNGVTFREMPYTILSDIQTRPDATLLPSLRIMKLWDSAGHTTNRNVAVLNNYYLVCVTDKIGSPGNILQFELEDTSSIVTIVADNMLGFEGKWGATVGGKLAVIGLCKPDGTKQVDYTGWENKKIVKVFNYGSFLG